MNTDYPILMIILAGAIGVSVLLMLCRLGYYLFTKRRNAAGKPGSDRSE